MTQEGLTDCLLSGEENVEHTSESKSLPLILFEMREGAKRQSETVQDKFAI